MQAVMTRWRDQWQSATLLDAGCLLLCALLFWASKGAGKLIEGVPGHAGAFWIPALFLSRRLVDRPGASTLTALLGAACWSVPNSGAGSLAPYVAAGLVLDVLGEPSQRLRRLPPALLAGALCHLVKFSFHNLPAALIGLSPHFLSFGLLPVAGLHLLFGLVGGFCGWVLMRLRSNRPGASILAS
jgi:hypothetical protein